MAYIEEKTIQVVTKGVHAVVSIDEADVLASQITLTYNRFSDGTESTVGVVKITAAEALQANPNLLGDLTEVFDKFNPKNPDRVVPTSEQQ